MNQTVAFAAIRQDLLYISLSRKSGSSKIQRASGGRLFSLGDIRIWQWRVDVYYVNNIC